MNAVFVLVTSLTQLLLCCFQVEEEELSLCGA